MVFIFSCLYTNQIIRELSRSSSKSSGNNSSSISSIDCCCSCDGGGGGGGGGGGSRKGVKIQLHLIKHDAKMPCKCVEVQLHAFSTTALDVTKQSASYPSLYIPDEKAHPYPFYWKVARPTAIWISGVEKFTPLGNRTMIPQLFSP